MDNGKRRRIPWLAITILLLNSSCRDQQQQDSSSTEKPTTAQSTVRVDLDARRPAMKLSDYGLFQDLTQRIPAAGVNSYQLNATSFIDGAVQQGFIWIPQSQQASILNDGRLQFPIGTILVQNILFPSPQDQAADGKGRLVETRLLIHGNKGWLGVPYLWNQQGTDADRVVIGAKTNVSVNGSSGGGHNESYITPNMNQCKRCHVNEDVMGPIGITAPNLNRLVNVEGKQVNQLQHWHSIGILDKLPSDHSAIETLSDWRDSESASVDKRARTWLQVNCAHCHNPHGPAIVSGLDLSIDQKQPVRFGVYKPPVAAGRGSKGHRFSILPNRPDESFLAHRINSNELGVMMPPLGRSTVDHNGVALIREWITQMPEDKALAEAALNPMKAYRDAVNGGDAERGKILFHKTQKCNTCHRIGDEGGRIGPNLSDVGKRTKREYLLESIVDPSAKIVKGFETSVVITQDGRVLTGVVQSEDEYEFVIADARASTKIRKDEVDEREASTVSTMPTVANLLTVDDVRDLIAYLVTLQDPPKK